MRKRFFASLLSLCMVVSLLPGTAFATGETWQGNGTAESPYQIATVEDLTALATSVNSGQNYEGKYFQLSDNIDLVGTSWSPIGGKDHPFKGTFDGNDKTVSNLTINNQDLKYAGLFGSLHTPGVLKNIKINNVSITAKAQVGALAGAAYTGTVSDCHVTGDISINGNYKVGGLAGEGYAKVEKLLCCRECRQQHYRNIC